MTNLDDVVDSRVREYERRIRHRFSERFYNNAVKTVEFLKMPKWFFDEIQVRGIENVREVIVMGGSVRLFNGLNLPLIEHNIKCDPEAARVVFSSGMPITMVPLDVTLKVTIERREIDLIRAAKTSLTDAIAMMITRYLDIVKRDYTWLHDPLALAVSIDNSLVKTIDAKILVETKGEYTTGQTIALPIEFNEKPVKVYIDVDIKRFKKFFMKRICLCV